jgi:hypothetical protein
MTQKPMENELLPDVFLDLKDKELYEVKVTLRAMAIQESRGEWQNWWGKFCRLIEPRLTNKRPIPSWMERRAIDKAQVGDLWICRRKIGGGENSMGTRYYYYEAIEPYTPQPAPCFDEGCPLYGKFVTCQPKDGGCIATYTAPVAGGEALKALDEILNFPEYPDLTPLTESEQETLNFIKVRLEIIKAALGTGKDGAG